MIFTARLPKPPRNNAAYRIAVKPFPRIYLIHKARAWRADAIESLVARRCPDLEGTAYWLAVSSVNWVRKQDADASTKLLLDTLYSYSPRRKMAHSMTIECFECGRQGVSEAT